MKLVPRRGLATRNVRGKDGGTGRGNNPVEESRPKRKRSPQKGLGSQTKTDLIHDPSRSTPTPAIAYFQLRKKVQKEKPSGLIDPQLISRQFRVVKTNNVTVTSKCPAGVCRRQGPSVTLTTTSTTTSTTVVTSVSVVPVSSVGANVTEVFIPPVVSTIPAIITTVVGPGGPLDLIPVTLRPPIVTTLVPATTIALGGSGGEGDNAPVLTVTRGGDMTASAGPRQTNPSAPRSSDGTSSSGSASPGGGLPAEPQSRLSVNHVPAIVGGTIGSVVFLILLVTAILLCRRVRRRMREAQPVLLPDPFPAERRAPVFPSQAGNFPSETSSPFDNIVSANITAFPFVRHTPPLPSPKSQLQLREGTPQSQSTSAGIQSQSQSQSQEGVVVIAASTPSPPPVSQDSATSELQSLRRRIEEIEELTRRRFREADGNTLPIAAPQPRRPSESPPEYASPIEGRNRE